VVARQSNRAHVLLGSNQPARRLPRMLAPNPASINLQELGTAISTASPSATTSTSMPPVRGAHDKHSTQGRRTEMKKLACRTWLAEHVADTPRAGEQNERKEHERASRGNLCQLWQCASRGWPGAGQKPERQLVTRASALKASTLVCDGSWSCGGAHFDFAADPGGQSGSRDLPIVAGDCSQSRVTVLSWEEAVQTERAAQRRSSISARAGGSLLRSVGPSSRSRGTA